MKTTILKKQQLQRLALRRNSTMTDILEESLDVMERFLDGDLVEKTRK